MRISVIIVVLCLLCGAFAQELPNTCTEKKECAACITCQRNEILNEDNECVCPKSKKACGEVTPFNNVIITAACIISSATLLIHVIHEICFRPRRNKAPTAAERGNKVKKPSLQIRLRRY